MDIRQKPHDKFRAPEWQDWTDYVYQLALRSLPVKDIAAKLGVHPQTLRNYEPIIAAIQEGHADHRLTIEAELFADATTNPFEFEPEERAAIRAARASALKILKQAIDKKDDFVPVQETERIRRLSDAELQEELRKHFEGKQ